jgi:hypothetical protein
MTVSKRRATADSFKALKDTSEFTETRKEMEMSWTFGFLTGGGNSYLVSSGFDKYT